MPQHKLSLTLGLAFLLSLASPSLNQYGHGLRLSWLIFPVWLILAISENHGGIRNITQEIKCRRIELSMLFFWFVFVIMNYVLDRGYTGHNYVLLTITIIMIMIIDIVYSSDHENERFAIVTLFLIILSVDIIRSLPILYAQPRIVLDITGGVLNPIRISQLALAGVGDYHLYTGLAIIVPALATRVFTTSGVYRLIFLTIVLAAIVAVVLSMFVAANLILALGLSIMGLIVVYTSPHKFVALFAVSIILLLCLWVFISIFSESEQGIYIVNKFLSQISSIEAGSLFYGTTTARAELYNMSIETFLKNPIWGIGPSSGNINPNMWTLIGGHSSWFDLPAEYGVFGFGFYALFFIAAVRRSLHRIIKRKDRIIFAGRLSSIIAFIACGFINPVAIHPIMLIFLFIIVLQLERKKQGKLLKKL